MARPKMKDVFSTQEFKAGDIVYARPVENGESDWDPSEKFRIERVIEGGYAVLRILSVNEIIPEEIPFRNLKKAI